MPARRDSTGVPAPLMVLAAASSVQFGAAIAVTLFDNLGPAGASALRVGLGAVILLAVWRPSVRGLPKADLRLVGALGLTLGVMNYAFYEALDRIPLGIAVTIEFAGPLGVAVALSRRRLDLVWVALAAAGILLLADPSGGSLDPVGLVLIGVAAAAWAAYILLVARAGERFTGGRGLALAMGVAALVPLGPGIAEAGADLLKPEFLGIGAAVALLSSVIPYSLEMEALRRIPRHIFGVLMSLEPALAALGGFVVLGQSLSGRDLVAIGLVMAASGGATRAAPPIDG
ncbi:MAG: inner rane transporter RhtA [Solirubrobacteraceae bacterium]|nr:inner rane transporter RhtA [Solirubrobacteraceae bacterium]